MKKLISLILVTLLMVSSCGNNDNSQNNTKPTVKIGVIIPLSGNMGYLGEAYKKAVTMAIDEVNADKNNKYYYELVIDDGGVDAKSALTIYNKYKNVDKIDAVITIISSQALALKNHTLQDKILQVAHVSDLAASDLKYNFINFISMETLSKTIVSNFKKNDIKKVSLVLVNTPDAVSLKSKLVPELERNSIDILSVQNLNSDDRNVSLSALKVKEEDPDILFIRAYEPLLSIYARELRRINFTKPMTTFALFSYAPDMSLFEGETYTDFSDGKEKFAEKYYQLYGEKTESASPMGYDNMMIITRLIEKYGRPAEQDNILDNFKNVVKNYDGANGKMDIDSDGVIHSPTVLKKIINGKPVTIKE